MCLYLSSPIRATCPAHYILNFITRILVTERCKLFPFHLLYPNLFICTLFFNLPRPLAASTKQLNIIKTSTHFPASLTKPVTAIPISKNNSFLYIVAESSVGTVTRIGDGRSGVPFLSVPTDFCLLRNFRTGYGTLTDSHSDGTWRFFP